MSQIDAHTKSFPRQPSLKIVPQTKPCKKTSDIHGVILAGGSPLGNRTSDEAVYGPLVPLAGRPLIWHTLNWLRKVGITRASICANSQTINLFQAIGDGKSMELTLDYYEDVMPRGPAGCAKDIGSYVDPSIIITVDGSILPQISLKEAVEAHISSQALITVIVKESGTSNNPSEQLLEPVGINIISRKALEFIPSTGYQDIKETLIPPLPKKGMPVLVYKSDKISLPRINNASSYLLVNKWLLKHFNNGNELSNKYKQSGEGQIHKSARLDPTVRLIGPVLIEPRCMIQAGAIIIGPTTIGADCVIGRNAVVSRSAIWAGSRIGDESIIDYSIVSENSSIKSYSTIRNRVFIASPYSRRMADGSKRNSINHRHMKLHFSINKMSTYSANSHLHIKSSFSRPIRQQPVGKIYTNRH